MNKILPILHKGHILFLQSGETTYKKKKIKAAPLDQVISFRQEDSLNSWETIGSSKMGSSPMLLVELL